jgi:hypothetical protein
VVLGSAATAFAAPVTPGELEQQVAKDIPKVAEFAAIRELAKELGVKVYLFGGAATGFAHYVRSDIERQKGEAHFAADKYDFDYTNIFQSTQDIDLVVDGTKEQATQLRKLLVERFPHIVAGEHKSSWDVRLLRGDIGALGGVLTNVDFARQHSDSYSTGLIEITENKSGPIVRDARAWEAGENRFLNDVSSGRITYLPSAAHGLTAFAKAGNNPSIFSAVRFLTKAHQYGVAIDPKDLAIVKSVVDSFDPKKDVVTPYARERFEYLVKNLVRRSIDVEKTIDLVESLGLKSKIIAMSDPNRIESMGWYVNKEPLRTFELGRGTGKTAAELGLSVIAHGTGDFGVYESLTSVPKGAANFFVSRKGFAGEKADHGKGLYTVKGEQGAGSSSRTIRMRLHPDARLGTDFVIENGDYVLVQNKAAVTVIQESLGLDLVSYIKMLIAGKSMDQHDLGLFEKQMRKWQRASVVPQAQKDAAASAMREALKAPSLSFHAFQWFEFSFSADYPDIFDEIVKRANPQEEMFLLRATGPVERWQTKLVDFIERSIAKRSSNLDLTIAQKVLSSAHWAKHPNWKKWTKALVDRKSPQLAESIIRYVIPNAPAKLFAPLVEAYLAQNNPKFDGALIRYVFSNPVSKDHPSWLETVIDRKTMVTTQDIPMWALSQAHWVAHPQLVARMLAQKTFHSYVGQHVLSQPHWGNHPEFIETLIKMGSETQIEWLMSMRHWQENPRLRQLSRGKAPTLASLKAGLAREAAAPSTAARASSASRPKTPAATRAPVRFCKDLFR